MKTASEKININSWNYKTMGVSLDGGSLILIFDDLLGHEKQLFFIQHEDLKYYREIDAKLPGRIYIDNDLVEKRSSKESVIIKYLEKDILRKLNTNQAEQLSKHIEFIKSEIYATNIPINQHLSEVRRNYINTINKELKFEINPVESKYTELHNGTITTIDFEHWVYDNEKTIIENYSQSVYDSLIILNYKSKHAKIEIQKIIKFSFRKNELRSLNQYLIKLSSSEKNIVDVNCTDSPDYNNYYFSFKMENIHIGLLNPFNLVHSPHSINKQKRIDEFIQRFQNPAFFFSLIKTELNTENIRLVIDEEIKELNQKDISEAYMGTQEELFIQIEKNRFIMNKEFVKTKMIKHWL